VGESARPARLQQGGWSDVDLAVQARSTPGGRRVVGARSRETAGGRVQATGRTQGTGRLR